MNPFSRRRRDESGAGTGGTSTVPGPVGPDTDDGSGGPGFGVDPAIAEAAEFTERLGDLDRFIGGGAAPAAPVSPAGPAEARPRRTIPTMPAPGASAAARNLPAAPIPAVAPISHPRPHVDAAPVTGAAAETTDEAAEFVERLGDLDRFIGGEPSGQVPIVAPMTSVAPIPPSAPVGPAAAAASPNVDPEDEAQEFLDRLGDLDRFIGGEPG